MNTYHFKYSHALMWCFLTMVACAGFRGTPTQEPVYIKRVLGNGSEAGSVLFLLHGYGSNENDLIGLSHLFPENAILISLRAPLTLSTNSYCWFPIEGHTTGTLVDTTAYHRAGNILQEWIATIVEKENLEGKKIFLAGFSQGAMMTYEMARRNASAYAGIIGFSGSVKALNHLPESSICGTDILMTHGKQDPVLTYESALQAKDKLEKCGAAVEFFTFEGGHQITWEALDVAKVWLHQRW